MARVGDDKTIVATVVNAEVVGTAGGGGGSLTSKLNELKAVKDEGLITDAEFIEAKMAALAQFTGGAGDGGQVVIPESPSSNATQCAFSPIDNKSFGQGGVLHAIGTRFGTAPYANPVATGKVGVDFSRDGANFYSTNGGHKVGDHKQASEVICAHKHPGANATQWSKGAAGAWFTLDLRGHQLIPTHFAYRNDYGGGGNHPRTFELQGSNDNRGWTTLSRHNNEQWSGKQAKSWPIQEVRQPFRFFKIVNQGSPNNLCCSGIEFYGTLIPADPSLAAVSLPAKNKGGSAHRAALEAAPDALSIDRAGIFDRSKFPNGGPRSDQNTCCVACLCLPNMVMCPLHCLATVGCADQVECLTSSPCKYVPCSPCDPNAMQPLWFCAQPVGWAASFGQLHVVMSLVKNGASPRRVNGAGENAWSDARRERHQHVVEWLDQWGALGEPQEQSACLLGRGHYFHSCVKE